MTNTLNYDLTDLRLFLAIAEAKNLTRGAKQVHLAPSSASHRLHTLEEAIGAPLFIRQARGLQLTEAGDALLHHTRRVFAQLEQMHADLSPYAKGIRGHVRLWANTHATHTYLPNDLSAFLQANPQVSISLEEHSSLDILMAVAKGEIELGIVADQKDDTDLTLIPYRTDHLVLITSTQHPLAQQPSIQFAQVLSEPFVTLHTGSSIHTFTVNAAAKLGGHLDVRIQVRSFEAVCKMVAAGVGVGLVPHSAVIHSPLKQSLRVIQLNEPWAQRNLKVCFKKEASLNPFATALVQALVQKNHKLEQTITTQLPRSASVRSSEVICKPSF